MDYADYLNEQIQQEYKLADAMEKTGCETFEEYANYLADLKAGKQERYLEMMQEEAI